MATHYEPVSVMRRLTGMETQMTDLANLVETSSVLVQKTLDRKKLVPPHVEALMPYQPGKPPEHLMKELGLNRIINLASNENSLGTPRSVLDAITETWNEINRYPEVGAITLRQALANRHRVKLDNVTVGAGSESILANALRTFLHGDDEVLTSEGTFIGLYVQVNAKGAKLRRVPLANYSFDLNAIAASITDKTKIIYLCNPNNPTGTIFKRAQFERFMQQVPENVLVILDEAYYEYAARDTDYPDSMTYWLDNVLTLRSFSKAFGMAGMRLGYGLAHETIIDFINRVKLPFEPNILAQRAGVAALKDRDFLVRTIENNELGKMYLEAELDALGFDRVPSHANFVFVEMHTAEKASKFHEALLRQGIAIRPLAAFGLPTSVRLTIGSPEEMQYLINALRHLRQQGAI